MSISIRPAGVDRVDDLAALLGRSFADDPMIVWPAGPDQLDLVTAIFRALNQAYAGHGWLWEASAGEGVAARRIAVDDDRVGGQPGQFAADGRHVVPGHRASHHHPQPSSLILSHC